MRYLAIAVCALLLAGCAPVVAGAGLLATGVGMYCAGTTDEAKAVARGSLTEGKQVFACPEK